ncbi:MAG: dephospho-CoA kinase [Solirubrobacterales bacterium]
MTGRAASPPAPFVGLTGAIASGKSAALAAFERLGAAVLSTDAVTHELLSRGEIADQLAERWGEEVAPGGVVDRERVGAIVFESREELRWLESVLHPVVGARIVEWRAALPDGTPVAVVEVPLLFETGMDAAFDATVAVVAPDEVRAERAGARGTARLAEREANQLSQEEKAARATHVLTNDGTPEELEAAIAALMSKLAAREAGA